MIANGCAAPDAKRNAWAANIEAHVFWSRLSELYHTPPSGAVFLRIQRVASAIGFAQRSRSRQLQIRTA